MDESLFVVKVSFQKRLFVNQHSAEYVLQNIKEVTAAGVEDFIQKIWNIVRENNLIEKEVVVANETVAWSCTDPTGVEEIDKFVIFYDVVGKRGHAPSKLTTDQLRLFRNKELKILVHVYSLNVSSKSVHTKVKRVLIDPAEKDKASAESTQRLFEVAEKLKEHHGHHLYAEPMAWNIWANSVLKKPSHLHEEAILQTPPDHLIHLFRAVALRQSEIMTNAQNGLRVARFVAFNNKNDLLEIRELVDQVKDSLIVLQSAVSNLDQRLGYLERMAERSNEFVGEVAQAMHVDEHVDSTEFANDVNDLEDLDHAET